MYILFLIVAVLIVGLVIKIAWPLIVATVAFLLVCYVLSILKERRDKKKAEQNIINAEFEEREG